MLEGPHPVTALITDELCEGKLYMGYPIHGTHIDILETDFPNEGELSYFLLRDATEEEINLSNYYVITLKNKDDERQNTYALKWPISLSASVTYVNTLEDAQMAMEKMEISPEDFADSFPQ